MINENKIFCIGFNKSGSSSLVYSIYDLGVGEHMDFSAGERLMPSYMDRNLPKCSSSNKFNKKLLEFCKSPVLFKDIPFSLPNVWKILYAEYPNAKYILSVRDSPEQWFTSITNYHKKFTGPTLSWCALNEVNYRYSKTDNTNSFFYDYMKSVNGNAKEPYDKDSLISAYNKHNNEVTEFFKDKPNFITINVAKDNDYAKLCKFLDVKSELTKFLHIQSNTVKPKVGTETLPYHLRNLE